MTLVLILLLGLAAGSFVNALVWRVHEQSKPKHSKKHDLSVLKGRSMCPHCHNQLAWYDLIPVISWLFLRGRCRYCGKTISLQYPLVEIAAAVVFGLSFAAWQPQSTLEWVQLASWLAVLTGLIALAVYDIKWMLLPDKILFPLYIPAVILVASKAVDTSDILLIFDAAVGSVVLGGTFYIMHQASKGRWIGGGDVKLGLLLGLIGGSALTSLMILFFASLGGSAISLPLLASKSLKAKSRIPFGPFLILGAVIAVLYGSNIVDWYTSQLLVI